MTGRTLAQGAVYVAVCEHRACRRTLPGTFLLRSHAAFRLLEHGRLWHGA